ncbi:uncharacterized protein LOC142179937 [Nicotiana tabacum]|uniref:Uncharacterized protein LOC142179937 n=1 Tax=Nicotiana tabacum TaxID=4097 RepID=A0AC58UBS3_TOBAC
MAVRSLAINKDPFRPHENDGELLGDETPYLSAIGALMYLANNTRPDITFAMQVICLIHIKPDLKQAIYLLMELNLTEDISKETEQNIFHQKFLFTHDHQQNGEIDVQQIRSSDNLEDLFTKALPTSTFEKLRHKIGMCRLRDIK